MIPRIAGLRRTTALVAFLGLIASLEIQPICPAQEHEDDTPLVLAGPC
jgi:hypothetical protein